MQARPDPEITAEGILTVRLDRIVSNYRHLARRCHAARCAAVVKANAYGLGAAPVAKALYEEGCTDFFVAFLNEGLQLRRALGPKPRIVVLNGIKAGGETICAEAGLTPVLNTMKQCHAWARMEGRPAALQVDTGMSRLGLSLDEQERLLAGELLADLNLVLLMSHLANADEPNHPGNLSQLKAFTAARSRFPNLPGSLANSAGIFLSTDFHFELCRPGAGLYGIDIGPLSEGLVPVVELHAAITQIRSVDAGTGVGYGYQFTADRPMRLATIGVGYADGWSRDLSGIGAVWLGHQRLSIVGRVSMDSFVVHVTDVASADIKVGDTVELLGPHQSADDVARMAGTVGYEVLTGLGPRYHRSYVWNLEATS